MWSSGYTSLENQPNEEEMMINESSFLSYRPAEEEMINITRCHYQSLDIENEHDRDQHSVLISSQSLSSSTTIGSFKQMIPTIMTISTILTACVTIALSISYNSHSSSAAADKLGKYVNKPLEVFEFRPWSDATPEQTGNITHMYSFLPS